MDCGKGFGGQGTFLEKRQEADDLIAPGRLRKAVACRLGHGSTRY